MRKLVVVVSAILLTGYFSAPVFAGEQTSQPGVGAAGDELLVAKGKRRWRKGRGGVRAKKPGLEETVRRIVDEAMREKPGAEWAYMAKRMRPPKSTKWKSRWNELGQRGWELVGQNENVYIFKRPASMASRDPAPAPKHMKQQKQPKMKTEKVKKSKKK